MNNLREELIELALEDSLSDEIYEINDNTNLLQDIDMDSLAIFQFIQDIEVRYDFDFGDADIIEIMSSFKNLYDFVESKIEEKDHAK